MNTNITFYSDFNIDLIKKLLLTKYGINSSSPNFTLERIQFKKPIIQKTDFCIIWFSIESFKVSYLYPSFKANNSKYEKLDQKIKEFIEEIKKFRTFYKQIIIFSFISNKQLQKDPLKSFEETGDSYISTKLNISLSESIKNISNIHLFDTQILINKSSNAFDIKNWYLTKNPFGFDFIKKAAKEIDLILRLFSNKSKIKIILLDLDNTIWGGEAGELDISKIRLGGHDHIGESFLDFQKTLVSFNMQGILIALVSKNEEKIAMNIFDNHPDMVLKRKHLISMKINWQPKYKNIISIMKDLNIGLDSALFIDDNPIERESIRQNLPEVNILELQKEPYLNCHILENFPYLYSRDVTPEDKLRTISYQQNQERNQIKSNHESNTSWLESLETHVFVSPVNNININRYVQLLNKTNQFNIRTRRMQVTEFQSWINFSSNEAHTIRLEDKFGDLGIIGLLAFKIKNNQLFVEDFVLSCRVAGRGIEEVMLYLIYLRAKNLNIPKIIIETIKTAKNKPILDFIFENPHFKKEKNNIFTVDLDKVEIEKPDYIKIKGNL